MFSCVVQAIKEDYASICMSKIVEFLLSTTNMY